MATELALKMTADEQNVIRALAAAQARIESLEGKIKTLNQTGKDQKRTSEDAFGSKAVANLTSYASGILSIGAAGGALVGLLRQVKEEAQQGAQALKSQLDGLKDLIQISDTSGEFTAKREAVRKVAVSEGVPISTATNIVTQAVNMGLMDQLDELAKVQRFGSASVGIEAVGKFYGAFGREEAGPAPAVISKMLKAAQNSALNFDTMARAAVLPAASLGALGTSDEETMALMSALAVSFASPEIAADRLRAIGETVQRGVMRPTGKKVRDPITNKMVDELKQIKFGGGLLSAMEQYRSQYPEDFARAMLERPQAGEAVRNIGLNLPAIQQNLADITAAGQTLEPLRQRLAIAEGDPMRSIRAAESARVAAEISGERYGAASLRASGATSAAEAYARAAGDSEFRIMFGRMLHNLAWFVNGDVGTEGAALERINAARAEVAATGTAEQRQAIRILDEQLVIMRAERTPGGIAPQELERSGN